LLATDVPAGKLASLALAFPDSLNLLLLDNSGAHTAQRLAIPDNVRLVFLPPYCPALNPIERGRRDRQGARLAPLPASGGPTRRYTRAPVGL
jgi:transposase